MKNLIQTLQRDWYLLYWIHYNKKNGDCENICSANLLYLTTGNVDRQPKENNGNKYLVFDSTDENKEVLKKFTKLWNGIKNKIETINGGKKVNMVKISWKLNLIQIINCH